MWTICLILTLTNALEEGHPARTDARLQVLTDSAWFYIPYPFQFGVPTVSIAGFGNLRLDHYFQQETPLTYFSYLLPVRCFGNVSWRSGMYC